MLLDESCAVPVIGIDPQECIGDSVGKMNYNALALDTTICNLSSLIYTNEYNVKEAIIELDGLLTAYQNLYSIYNEDYKNRIKLTTTTVNLLSSFWGHYQFSVSVPINTISLSSNDLSILAFKLSTVNLGGVERLVKNNLKSITETYLNTKYNPQNYPTFTVINASFLLYNIVPILTPTNNFLPWKDPLIKQQLSPVNTFNYTQRIINGTYSRDNVYVSTGLILRFYNDNQRWIYMGYFLNDNIRTAQPNYNTLAIRQFPEIEAKTASKKSNSLSECKPLQKNTWYSNEQYIYSNSLYTGTSTKLGTISITLRTPQNEVETFSYKANGYNANTNTGGSDVYLEFDGDIINAYEEYPIPKTLVQSWINPFKNKRGVNFKFTIDNNGVDFTCCGSTSLI